MSKTRKQGEISGSFRSMTLQLPIVDFAYCEL